MRPNGILPALALLVLARPSTAAAPKLDHLDPSGGRRGATVQVEALGTFDRWPVKVRVVGEGLAVEPAEAKGSLRVVIAPDARPGVRWIRLFDDEGASAPRPFLVGHLPEVAEAEPNDAPVTAQPVAIEADAPGVVVNGRLGKNGDVDGYRVELKAGQTLVAAVEANRRLGSPMDGVLQVASPAGFVLAHADDDGGRDPVLVYAAPADGPVVVRLFAFPATPDSRIGFSGGKTFIYRLTLATGGVLDASFPLAVTRGQPGQVEAAGWSLPPGAYELDVPDGDGPTADVWDPRLAGEAEVLRLAMPTAREAGTDGPEDVTPPVALSGRIDPPGDRDRYRFRAAAGSPLAIAVESRSLGRPLDAVIRVRDASGKVLQEGDDSGRGDRDPEITFKPPAEGEYTVEVADLNGQGGPRHAYLLRIAPPTADVRLKLKDDRLVLEPGTPLEVAVTVQRLEGFDGSLEVVAEGLPEGVAAAAVISEPKGDSAKSVKLTLTAQEGGSAWSGPVRILGRVEGCPQPAVASAPIEGREASTSELWLTVRPKPAAGPKP